MHAILAVLAFYNAHEPLILAVGIPLGASLLTYITKHPTAYTPAILALLQLVLARASLAEHKDSDTANPFKFPLMAATPSDHPLAVDLGSARAAMKIPTPPSSLPIILILGGSLLAAPRVHAQTVPVATPAPSFTPCDSKFGGPIGPWTCVGPSISLTPVAINLHTKTIEGGFPVGGGYGFQVHKEAWWTFGADVHVNINVGAQQASIAILGNFANYFCAGWEKGFIGDVAPRLLFGLRFGL